MGRERGREGGREGDEGGKERDESTCTIPTARLTYLNQLQYVRVLSSVGYHS